MRHFDFAAIALVCCLAPIQAVAERPSVNESAAEIPVAYEVDVCVVGGGVGAVAAALAAKAEGAEVFLAAPYPYLGDDMTATLRLWLEEGEEPQSDLAQKIFSDAQKPVVNPNALPFRYKADRESSPKHPDTKWPTLLNDGQYADPVTQSVQYDGDVTITADLNSTTEVEKAQVVVFHRWEETEGGGGFNVESVTVSISDDGKLWREAATAPGKNPPGEGHYIVSLIVNEKTRYLKFFCKQPEKLQRILLGEIAILAPGPVEKKAPRPPSPRPFHIKKTLDDELLAAGVKYLYSCLPTDVLRDAAGEPCGIVIANRAGRQAVVAKTIIDATDRAAVARLAGADFRPYPAGRHVFKRTVIGGKPQTADNMTHRIVDPPFHTQIRPGARKDSSEGAFNVIEYTLTLEMPDDRYASWMAADQQARTLTYHPDQQYTSDRLFEIPPDPMRGEASASGEWQGVDALPIGAFQPKGTPHLFVLGGCVDVSREQAAKLLRPLALMDLGERLGKAAAEAALSRREPAGVRVPGEPLAEETVQGDTREFLDGLRPIADGEKQKRIPQSARAVPVLGEYDVVVIGGGTGGAPAGIAAARQGAKTLVVEYLHGLGGVGTEGAIASYYWGNRVGFTATVVGGARSWKVEPKKQWWRNELLAAGGEVWFGTLGCGAFMDGGGVKGAVVTTPQGRGVVLAKVVIDSTGNSDVAAAAGAQTQYTDASEFGMQGTGLPGRKLGGSYNNTDFTLVDETDMLDVWRMFVFSKEKYAGAFDHGRLIDTRERRRIVGDATITILDQMNRRTYPDTVCRAYSNFDTHGYTIDPYLLVEHPEKVGFHVDIPYRAMLPKGLEGMLVTGLGISAHRDAVPLIRMQADIQNGGYAAGVAAAMSYREGKPLRKIDIKRLQRHLVEMGNLPESVLTDKDSYPFPPAQIAAAVAKIPEGKGAAVVLASPQAALPLVKDAYAKAEDQAKVAYARLLAAMDDATGAKTLIDAIAATPQWDKGWNYKGMGQFGNAYSPLDTLIVAAGHTRDPKAVPAIVEKIAMLSADDAFSHHRAVGRALELIGDARAAKPLAQLLQKPGMAGYAQTDIETAIERGAGGGTNAEQARRESLRELMLARALFRCGDYQGLGRTILETYTKDLRGHLARHAQAVLEEGKAAAGN